MGQLKNVKVNLPGDMIALIDEIVAERNKEANRPHSRSSFIREAVDLLLEQPEPAST